MVVGDAFKNSGEGAGFDWLMAGHDLVVFSVLLARDTDVRAFLPVHNIPKNPKRLDKLWAVDIAGQLHRAKTSSLTK